MTKPPSPYGIPVTVDCRACLSRETSIFRGLSKAALEELYSILQTAVYPAKALLFVEDELPRGVFCISAGQAKLSACSRAGKRITLRLAGAGETLGLSCVIANRPYRLTAETLVPSQVCFFPRREFLRFLNSHGEMAMRVAEHLSAELHAAWDHICLLGLACSSRAKLAHMLMACAEKRGRPSQEGLRVPLNMTEEEIGEAIGVTRETVSRLLSDFKQRGWIRSNGGSILIVCPDELQGLRAD